ncbi:hypothetical protein M527_06410 [Sphingobium indicum IP26]|uniref:hypothetical protein n=1 Tax=Sphingobium indicum TaxID=332055 RepID=UPI00037227D6|nr:hypothetical protein [Sphingobium indicum]EPR09756.1 hypothetical protein M527_06410 [Sphingobium indicum IP26]
MTDDYRLILACYLSGQIDDATWQQHLAEPLFALWLEHTTAKTPRVGATRDE